MASRAERLVNYGLLTIFSLIVLFPLIGISIRALDGRPDLYGMSGVPLIDQLGLQAVFRAWETGRLATSLVTSAILASSITTVATLLSILAGYAFGAMRFRGSNVLFVVFLLALLMPHETLIIPLYYGLRVFGLTDTHVGVALPHIALFLSFGIFWMRSYFRSLPRSLLEAARMDGAGTWATLWRVLVPSGRPAIMTLIVLFFVWAWNSYLLYVVLAPGGKVLPVALSLTSFVGERQTDEAAQAAVSVIISLPVILVYLIFQRHFIRGMLSGAVKG
jgi:raffinose/stachyose/melibiose transport system permease protein